MNQGVGNRDREQAKFKVGRSRGVLANVVCYCLFDVAYSLRLLYLASCNRKIFEGVMGTKRCARAYECLATAS